LPVKPCSVFVNCPMINADFLIHFLLWFVEATLCSFLTANVRRAV
jgi:hypothetical protein